MIHSAFLNNKYTTCYFNIINKITQLNRIKYKRNSENFIYYEKHHIIPKSIGGTNDKSNLIFLTAREHYICHMLLTKMTENNNRRKMCYAFWGLNNQINEHQARIKSSSRFYEYSKKIMRESLSQERKGKTLEERYGPDRASEIKITLSKRTARGPVSEDEKDKISNRIRNASANNPWIRNFEVNQPEKKICEKCNINVDLGNYTRHHGDNCKRKYTNCLGCHVNFNFPKYEHRKYCSKFCSDHKKK